MKEKQHKNCFIQKYTEFEQKSRIHALTLGFSVDR